MDTNPWKMPFRIASNADIPIIQEIAYAAWPPAYSSIISQEQIDYMLHQMYDEKALASQMRQGHRFILLEEGEKTLGFASVQVLEKSAGKLHKLYLRPEEKGQGRGRSLLMEVFKQAQDMGIETLLLNVNRANPAYYFYLNMGFEVHETIDLDIGNGFYMNDFIMKKQLKA